METCAKVTLSLILFTFMTATILHKIYSSPEEPPSGLTWHPLLPAFGDLMVLSSALFIGYLVQAALQHFQITTPYGGIIIIIGYLWGIFCYYDEVAMYASNIMNISSQELTFIFIPVIVFQMSFNMDVYLFLKTITQTFVIAVFVNLGSAVLFGALASYIISSTMPEPTGIILGIFASPIFPQSVTNILKQHTTTTKQISVLLEGEALFAFLIADYTFKIVLSEVVGFMRQWYQIIFVTLRVVLTAVPAGFFFGYIGRNLIRKMYTNRLSVYLVCMGIPFLTHSFSEIYLSGCGSISVMIVGAMLGMERTLLPKEIDTFLTDFWNMVAYVMDVILLLKGAMLTASTVAPRMEWFHYPLTFVIYVANYTMRFLCFLVYLPVIRNLGYGMNLKYLIVCTWGALKSPLGILTTTVFTEHKLYPEIARIFMFYIIWLYFFSVFINGSLITIILDFLDLTKISMARQINMHNCMTHIFGKRDRTIDVLKMDRFLADVNWPVVIEATEMTHPYQIGMTDEEEEGFLGYRFTHCGDCKKDVLQEPTQKEMKEMMREAKMRILKVRRTCYSRQYENGMMTKEGIRILSRSAELAMDSSDAEMKTENIYKNFIRENWCKRFIRRQSQKFSMESKYKKPRTYWRRLCYKIVLKNTMFEKVMIGIVILNMLVILVDLYAHPSLFNMVRVPDHTHEFDYILVTFKCIFILIFLTEVIMKILAYSWVYICYHGIRTYFKSFWNIMDVLAIIGTTFSVVYNVHDKIAEIKMTQENFNNNIFRQITDGLRLIRAVRLLRIFEIFYLDVISYLNKREDETLALSFELGKGFIAAENEILNMLPYMIDNTNVRNAMKQKIEEDKLVLQQLLGLVQKNKPWIAITVKTRQAIRMILNGMKEAINQLKSTGWVDTYEYEKLLESMDELYKKVNAIKKVEPSSPTTIFKEVAWMAENEDIIDFLFENVAVRTYGPGEVVFAEGEIADGIYILVTGLLIMTYKPNVTLVRILKEQGLWPIVDYLSVAQYEQDTIDYIISGNCLGELSTLTERPHNCTITADAHSQVYVLSRSVLRQAMEMSPDPVTGLEAKIWKEISLRITIPILLSVPAYQTLSQDQIKYALERAFVPDLKKFKIFVVTDMIEDIVLIRGVIVDYNTTQNFVAPCYIPRTVQRLVLPASSLMNTAFRDPSQTKLLIIPSKDVDEYDVMMLAKDTCELISTGSSMQCLQHSIDDPSFNSRRRKSIRRAQVRMRGPGVDNAPSVGSSMVTQTSSYHSEYSAAMMFKSNQSEIGSVFMSIDEEVKHSTMFDTDESYLASSPSLSEPENIKRKGGMFFM